MTTTNGAGTLAITSGATRTLYQCTRCDWAIDAERLDNGRGLSPDWVYNDVLAHIAGHDRHTLPARILTNVATLNRNEE